MLLGGRVSYEGKQKWGITSSYCMGNKRGFIWKSWKYNLFFSIKTWIICQTYLITINFIIYNDQIQSELCMHLTFPKPLCFVSLLSSALLFVIFNSLPLENWVFNLDYVL